MAICWGCVVRLELNVSFCRWKISKKYWSHRRLYAVRVRVKWVNLRKKMRLFQAARPIQCNRRTNYMVSSLLNVLIFNLLEQREKENLMNSRCSPNRHKQAWVRAHTVQFVSFKGQSFRCSVHTCCLPPCVLSLTKSEKHFKRLFDLWMKVFVWRLFVFCTMWKRKLTFGTLCLDVLMIIIIYYIFIRVKFPLHRKKHSHTFFLSRAMHGVQMWSRKFIIMNWITIDKNLEIHKRVSPLPVAKY